MKLFRLTILAALVAVITLPSFSQSTTGNGIRPWETDDWREAVTITQDDLLRIDPIIAHSDRNGKVFWYIVPVTSAELTPDCAPQYNLNIENATLTPIQVSGWDSMSCMVLEEATSGEILTPPLGSGGGHITTPGWGYGFGDVSGATMAILNCYVQMLGTIIPGNIAGANENATQAIIAYRPIFERDWQYSPVVNNASPDLNSNVDGSLGFGVIHAATMPLIETTRIHDYDIRGLDRVCARVLSNYVTTHVIIRLNRAYRDTGGAPYTESSLR